MKNIHYLIGEFAVVDIDLSIEIAGIRFKNPVMNGACDITCDFERVKEVVEGGVGGIVTKTMASNPRERTRPRPYLFSFHEFGREMELSWVTCETANWISAEDWAKEDGPRIVKFCHEREIPVIGSVLGDDAEDTAKLARIVSEAGVDMIEIPLASCPNLRVGREPKMAGEWMQAITKEVSIPVVNKPPINADLTVEICQESERAGAAALTSCFSTTALVIDVEREEPRGAPWDIAYQPGPVQRPIVMGLVAAIMRNVEIPIIGGCGVVNSHDALEFLLLGCPAVQVASAPYFKGKKIWGKIREGITDFMIRKGYSSVKEFQGKAFKRLIPLEKFAVEEQLSFPSPITPVLTEEKCIYCIRCTNACVFNALQVDAQKRILHVMKENCHGCGLCVSICPTHALKLVDSKGRVYWDGRGSATFYP